jgi:hypothetical protein
MADSFNGLSNRNHVRNVVAADNRRERLGLGPAPKKVKGFPSLYLATDARSEEAQERSRYLDNKLREHLGLPPVQRASPRDEEPTERRKYGARPRSLKKDESGFK